MFKILIRKLMVLFLAASVLVTPLAQAQMSAQKIFGSMGTVSTDPAGVLSSQSRTIFSMGGGLVTIQGKKLSLMAADPPSFSAGCAGISWHFGGFSFISVDEIRQMIEAISQASLGVVIDLAIQVLCPQCYAVMNKMRDLAAMMRNKSYDACSVGKHLGAQLATMAGFTPIDKSKTDCSAVMAQQGRATSQQGAELMANGCKTITDTMDRIGEGLTTLNSWMDKATGGTAKSGDKKTPSQEELATGNISYKNMLNLGFSEGAAMSILLSSTGMLVRSPMDTNCQNANSRIRVPAGNLSASILTGSPEDGASSSGPEKTLGKPNDETSATEVIGLAVEAKKDPSSSSSGPSNCVFPPLINSPEEAARMLVCGHNPPSDARIFAQRYAQLFKTDVDVMVRKLAGASGLGAFCKLKSLTAEVGTGAGPGYSTKITDPIVYKCEGFDCPTPQAVRLSTLMTSPSTDPNVAPHLSTYTGVGWMVLDALFHGVHAVKTDGANYPSPSSNMTSDVGFQKVKMPIETLRIISASDYPLYRLINLTAVYPSIASEILFAYGSTIAILQVTSALREAIAVGNQARISVKDGGAVTPSQLMELREQVEGFTKTLRPLDSEALAALSRKRALVDFIQQTNRAIQAEAMQYGLAGNATMGVSLRKSASSLPTSTP